MGCMEIGSCVEGGRGRGGWDDYEKLYSSSSRGGRNKVVRRRGRWMKKILKKGMMKGFRLKKLKSININVSMKKVCFLMMLLSRRIREIMHRVKVEEVCPNIIFSTQWGLPVLSYSS